MRNWAPARPRHTPFDLRTQRCDDPLQVTLGFIKHAEVIERTPAAQFLFWNLYPPANCLQNLKGGFRCFRMEVVVEGVCPKNHIRSGIDADRALAKPIA